MRRDYIKKEESVIAARIKEFTAAAVNASSILNKRQRLLLSAVAVLIIMPILLLGFCIFNRPATISEDDIIGIVNAPLAVASAKRGVITVPTGMVKADPFLPYRDIGEGKSIQDIPAFNLVEPPEVINENSDAARLMDTIVSGILYDKYSPSAILNIEGNDYLVKKGDVVNNYKIVSIGQDAVTVKLGTNTYTAGIGEILTEGTIHYNDVSNLNKKFGGAK